MRLARTAAPLPRNLAGRSRTCDLRRPKPVGWPAPLQPVVFSTPGGPRTRSFRVESPASSPVRPRGHGMAKLRRQGSNLPLAINSRASCRLDHAGTRAEVAGLEPANGSRRLRGSNALPRQLGHASTKRKERESNPQGPRAHPFSRRDTAPVQSFPEWPRQASNLQPST